MEVSEQPSLKFHGVDIANVQFDCKKYFNRQNSEIKMNLNPTVLFETEKENFFKIIMELSLSSKEYFKLELLAIGTFEIAGQNIDAKIRNSFVNANAPAIMFPYVRAFVHNFSINLGNTTGGLTIPAQFFQGELQTYRDTTEEE